MKRVISIVILTITINLFSEKIFAQKISDLPETTTIAGPDLLHVVKLAPNIGYKMTFSNFRNYLINTSGTGILPVVNGGTGSSASATNGTLLRGNGSLWVPTALTFPNSTSNYEMLYSDGANNIISSPYVKASLYGIAIGVVTPTDPLSPLWVADGYDAAYKLHIRNTSNGTAASTDLKLENNVQATGEVGVRSSLFTTNGVDVANRIFLKSSNSSNGIAIFTTDNKPIVFATNGTTEKMRLSATGYLGVGTTNPLATLHVSGFSRIDAVSGSTGLEISTSNSMALSLLSGGGGIEITNTSVASPAIYSYSNSDGIISHALGTGAEISSPGLVFRSNNSGVLSANSTMVANSFEDNRVIGAFTATGNFFQIRRNNASTGNLFVVKGNSDNDFLKVTYDGLTGFGTGTVTPTARIYAIATGSTSSTYAIKINDSNSDTLVHVRNDGALMFGSNGTNSTAGDAATINQPTGSFVKDASGSSFTLTNSLITAKSKVFLQLVTTGITAGYQLTPQAGSGTCTITFETAGVAAAPNASATVNFWVVNY